MDATDHLSLYQLTPKELAVKIMADINETMGITATARIGTNLYLAKVDLDITAKQFMPFDALKGFWEALAEYFCDGEYVQITGVVSAIDKVGRILKIVNTKVSFNDISPFYSSFNKMQSKRGQVNADEAGKTKARLSHNSEEQDIR